MDRKTIKIEDDIFFSEEITLQIKKQIRRLFFLGIFTLFFCIVTSVFCFLSYYFEFKDHHFKIFLILLFILLLIDLFFMILFGIYYYRFSKYIQDNLNEK